MSIEKKNISAPDNTIDLPDGSTVKHMTFGEDTVTVVNCKPGWTWDAHVKPRVGTEKCDKEHVGYVVSGRMACKMKGQEDVVEFGPGDAFRIHPGHDAWVVGDSEAKLVEFTPKNVTPYAMKKE